MIKNIGKFPIFKLGKHQIIVLILFVAVLAFTASFIIAYLSPNSKRTNWQNAEVITPQSLLKTVLSQKSIRYLDISSIKVMRIPSHMTGNLYIFGFRAPQLCGSGGCLYSIYNESGNTLLEFVANPYLPPKENLIQATDINNSGFSCLIITQSTSKENIVSRTRYCYHKGKYIRLNQTLTEVGNNLKGEH